MDREYNNNIKIAYLYNHSYPSQHPNLSSADSPSKPAVIDEYNNNNNIKIAYLYNHSYPSPHPHLSSADSPSKPSNQQASWFLIFFLLDEFQTSRIVGLFQYSLWTYSKLVFMYSTQTRQIHSTKRYVKTVKNEDRALYQTRFYHIKKMVVNIREYKGFQPI